MKKLFLSKRALLAQLLLVLAVAQSAHAGAYDMITSAVNFTDLTAAMGVVYGGIVVFGIFSLGGEILVRKLGWKK
jgi:hypothetical protein